MHSEGGVREFLIFLPKITRKSNGYFPITSQSFLAPLDAYLIPNNS